MKVIETRLDGVLMLEPRVLGDERGYFLESWNVARYEEHGIAASFVQDNLSFSRRGVLRGLHFQNPTAQGKLVSVLQGAVFDVAVDLRAGSPNFGKWFGAELSAQNHRQLWIPEGFAHGFQVTSEAALFSYKCTGYYAPGHERSLRWDDPELAIDWPLPGPIISAKDAAAPFLRDLAAEHLFAAGPIPTESAGGERR